MTDTPDSPAPAPSAPASTTQPAAAPAPAPVTPGSKAWAEMTAEQRHARLRGPENPRSRGYSPARDQLEAARARAAGEAPPGDQPAPPPTADQQQQGEKIKVFGKYEISEIELASMMTRQAADEVRKAAFDAALPTPDAYKAELPADFKPPPGVEFKIDPADPALVQFKQFAHKYRLPQEAFAEGLAIHAGKEVGTQAAIDGARAAQVAKLGAAGPARIDNLMRVMDGNGLGVLKSSLVTAAQVEALEKFFANLQSQGVGPFSQQHRVAPDADNRIPGFENMSFEQRRHAQDTIASARRGR